MIPSLALRDVLEASPKVTLAQLLQLLEARNNERSAEDLCDLLGPGICNALY